MSADLLRCGDYRAGRCGSCTAIAVPYLEQLSAKTTRIRAALNFSTAAWHGMAPSALGAFRNKAKMAVTGDVMSPQLGLASGIDLGECPLYPPVIHAAFAPIRAFIATQQLRPYDVEARCGELKFVLLTAAPSGALMLRFVLRSREALDRIRAGQSALFDAIPGLHVVSVNLQPVHQAVVEGPTEIVLSAEEALPIAYAAGTLWLPPGAFLQTQHALGEALYRQTAEWLELVRPMALLDLYCGIGGFAWHLSTYAKRTVGVESHPASIAGARRATEHWGPRDICFVQDDAAAYFATHRDAFDCLVVNPPRRGIGTTLANHIEQSAVQTLIYSSCNLHTLASDLAALPSFEIMAVRGFDLFAHTDHFETLVHLRRSYWMLS